jgi:hypothetical protein
MIRNRLFVYKNIKSKKYLTYQMMDENDCDTESLDLYFAYKSDIKLKFKNYITINYYNEFKRFMRKEKLKNLQIKLKNDSKKINI